MKASLIQSHNNRRIATYRSAPALLDGGGGADGTGKSPANCFWLFLHGLCCLISLVLGFRFSRLVFFLLFSTTTLYTSAPVLRATTTTTTTTTTTRTETLTLSLPTPPPPPPPAVLSVHNRTRSRVGVGRHGIRIRPWPHPNPAEVMRAHRIIDRVQREQRLQYGVKEPRPLVVVTPTYVRTFQALHLTGLLHSLLLVPYSLTWIVVEAGGVSNETAAILARSQLPLLHIPFPEKMPTEWAERHQMEARMRLHALRVVSERTLDGIVVFADDSNIHSMEFFDEVQKVKWMGAISVGILAHSGNSEPTPDRQFSQEEKENFPVPIQGPACNSSGQLVGWHTFNSLPYREKSATFVGEAATVLPRKLEWAGFVLNSKLLWKEADEKPNWVRDLDAVGEYGEEIEDPLALLKDESFIEPLGSCGKKALLWWLRVEARSDSKFPPGWIIDPPLKVTAPAKRTPWFDPSLELQSQTMTGKDHVEGWPSRISKSHNEKKQDSWVDKLIFGMTQRREK